MKRFLLLLVACLLPMAAHAQQPIPIATGVNIHTWSSVGWNNATDMALIRDAGFKFVRVDLGWRWTETKKNQFNFSLADSWLAAADANGLRVILTLDYNNPLYSGSSDDKTGIANRATWEAYARWAEAAARHFKNRGVIWELWNEPNNAPFWKPGPSIDPYSIAAKLAYTGIRQYAGSSDPVIGPASTFSDKNVVDQKTPYNGLTFLNNLFARGQLDYLDGVSVHSYRPGQSSPAGRPESVFGFYFALNGVMAGYGKTRPIISGEWGYSRTEVNEQTQAKFLARSFLCNSLAGVPLSIHYNYTDSSGNTRDRESNFGIVGYQQPRRKWAAFAAARQVNSLLNGGLLTSASVTNAGQDFLLTYAGAAGTTHVAWTTAGVRNVTLPDSVTAGSSGIMVKDYLGKDLPVIVNAITLDDGPKYLRPVPNPPIAAARAPKIAAPKQESPSATTKGPSTVKPEAVQITGQAVLRKLNQRTPRRLSERESKVASGLAIMGWVAKFDSGWLLTDAGRDEVKKSRAGGAH